MRGYTTAELSEASGLARRVLDRWHDLGKLRASVAEGFQGAGGTRLYSEDQHRAAAAIGRLAPAFPAGIPTTLVEAIAQAAARGEERATIPVGTGGAVLVVGLGRPEAEPTEPAA